MQATLEDTLRRARLAQIEWAAKPLHDRLLPIAGLRARLAREGEKLADVVADEIGKTRFEALGAEILPTAETCEFLIKRGPGLLAPRREPFRGTVPFSGSATVRHLPWGIVALLVPWNYPLFLCAGSALNALAAGNAVVMKPSPRAKETVAAFAQWLYDAGIPPELAPVLESSDEMGKALVASPLINRIVFTGSSKTGRSVLTAAAQNLVPATVELSGFDAVFVLADANLNLAADAVSFGVRINAGRTCICPRRVFVESAVAAEFTRSLSQKLTARKLLAPMDPQTLREADELAAKLNTIPGVSVLNGRKMGDAEKAIAVSGGPDAQLAAQGNFVPAVVVTQVKDSDEALRLDASTQYALGASIFTENSRTAYAIASKLRSGMIAVNECLTPAAEAALPFGGSGESGYGVRSGVEGLMEMTRPQTLAFSRGTYRPHHVAESEAEALILALLRARHSGSLFSRLKGWCNYAIEGIKWKPKQNGD